MRPLNVAVIGTDLPYPPTAGYRIRTLNLLEPLAGRHHITFLARRGRPEETAEAVAYLNERGIATILIDEPIPPKSGARFYLRLAANLFSSRPYSVATHGKAGMRRAVRDFAAAQRVDLWQAEWVAYIDAMSDLRTARKLLISHNVESVIWNRYHDMEENVLKRLYIGQQWRKFERFERRAFAEATRVVAVSDEDSRLIRERFGGRRVDVVDNGINRAYFEAVRPERDPNQILFLGSLDWRPNLDAINLLFDRILPAVRREVPSARLCLVGRKPSEALARRARAIEGVDLHADVPDVRPYLARSAVMAVPLRIGGGSRLKILEALATGLPVVSTRVGAEGLELVADRHYHAADEPEVMVGRLVQCLHDPDSSLRMADSARQLVLARYDWNILAERLERAWYACLETTPDLAPSSTPIS